MQQKEFEESKRQNEQLLPPEEEVKQQIFEGSSNDDALKTPGVINEQEEVETQERVNAEIIDESVLDKLMDEFQREYGGGTS